MNNSGIIFILSAPSGGGKTTLARGLLSIISNLLLSISITTRPKRANELDAREYFFKTKKEVLKLIEEDMFLEYATIYDHYYGTLKSLVYEPLSKKIDMLFDIDWQGAKSIKAKVINNKIVSIFILPPSLEILKQRLIFRDQDTSTASVNKVATGEFHGSHLCSPSNLGSAVSSLNSSGINLIDSSCNNIEQRLNLALEEISHAKDYDYIVINDNFDQCLEELKAIIIAERIKNNNLDKLSKYL